MPRSTWGGLVRKNENKGISSQESLTILDFCFRPVAGEEVFRHQTVAPVLGPQQKQNWLCRPLPLFMAIIVIPKVRDIRVVAECFIHGGHNPGGFT